MIFFLLSGLCSGRCCCAAPSCNANPLLLRRLLVSPVIDCIIVVDGSSSIDSTEWGYVKDYIINTVGLYIFLIVLLMFFVLDVRRIVSPCTCALFRTFPLPPCIAHSPTHPRPPIYRSVVSRSHPTRCDLALCNFLGALRMASFAWNRP